MAQDHPHVVVYLTPFCPYCFLAKRLLRKRGVDYEGHIWRRAAESRDRLAELSGGGRTYPQIIIDGQPVGGYAELRRLDRKGDLALMLSGSR
jgi:glutaredoxin 3